jgi:hypothetical protein
MLICQVHTCAYQEANCIESNNSIKYIYSHPKNDNKIGPKYKISSECSLSQNNKKHYCNIFRSCLPFIVRKRQRRSQLSHLIGYIKRHLQLWVCLTLQCTVLWMVRGLVSQIDPKNELNVLTTLIIMHSGDKSDFLPILQKMQNITIIYERNACQVRLKYTWLKERFYR